MSIRLENINKSFKGVQIFNNYNLDIDTGESVAILGNSGSGKTTLLNIIACFEPIDSGQMFLDGREVKITETFKMNYWRYHVGCIFQNYALIDNLTIDKNLDIALKYSSLSNAGKKLLKDNALQRVGLETKGSNYVFTLSGGEQQRLAIARLLIKPCEIILADEPTGALDSENKKRILGLLNIFKEDGKTLIMVTHDKDVAQICDRVIHL